MYNFHYVYALIPIPLQSLLSPVDVTSEIAVTAPPYDVGFRLWATVNPRTTPIHNTIDSLMNFTSLPLIGDYEEKIPTNLITVAKENASVLEVFLRSHW